MLRTMMSFRGYILLVVAAAVVIETAKSKARYKWTRANKPEHVKGGECTTQEFQCQDGDCIQAQWFCDTENDCLDHSDEQGCPSNCTGVHQLKCANRLCIPIEYQCDGDNDCGDHTDEIDCHKKTCHVDEIQCDNFLCIEAAWKCDGTDDCGNGWDEKECAGNCSDDQFRCKDGSKCIDSRWKCDGMSDCVDASDELSCVCQDTEWKCQSGLCIISKWRCDGEDDCGDASDELNCPTLEASICDDMLSFRGCNLMNETDHPICLDPVDGHKFCRKFCQLCVAP